VNRTERRDLLVAAFVCVNLPWLSASPRRGCTMVGMSWWPWRSTQQRGMLPEATSGFGALEATRSMREALRQMVALHDSESHGTSGFTPVGAEHEELLHRLNLLTGRPPVPRHRTSDSWPYRGVVLRDPAVARPPVETGSEPLFPLDGFTEPIEYVVFDGLIVRYDRSDMSVVAWEDPDRRFEAWLLGRLREHGWEKMLIEWDAPRLSA
jgi:hypothetical protein